MKKFLFLLLAVSAATLPALAQQDTIVEEIVARVNNSIITRADLHHAQEEIIRESHDQNLSASAVAGRQKDCLRDLIDQELLVQRATDLGISADTDLVKRLDELRQKMGLDSMEALESEATKQGISWEEFKQNAKNGILTQKVISEEVGAHVNITRDEELKFYNDHKAELDQPEGVRLAEILVSPVPLRSLVDSKTGQPLPAPAPTPEQIAAARAKADGLLAKLKAGAKFEDLARSSSDGATAAQGGDLGFFKRGSLAKQLEDPTFALKPGETTGVIETRQGYVILKVVDHLPGGLPPFEKIEPQLQEAIYVQKIQPALREYLTKLRENAYLDIKPGYVDSGASPNQTKLVYTNTPTPTNKNDKGKLRKHKRFLLF